MDRECAAGPIGRGYPASPLWIMRSIHGYIYGMGLSGEVLLERLPHLKILALQAIRLQREARGVKHQLGLEHEGQRIAEIMRLEFGIHGTFKGLRIRPVSLHTAMQAG